MPDMEKMRSRQAAWERARRRALQELAHRHEPEYREILQVEGRREGITTLSMEQISLRRRRSSVTKVTRMEQQQALRNRAAYAKQMEDYHLREADPMA